MLSGNKRSVKLLLISYVCFVPACPFVSMYFFSVRSVFFQKAMLNLNSLKNFSFSQVLYVCKFLNQYLKFETTTYVLEQIMCFEYILDSSSISAQCMSVKSNFISLNDTLCMIHTVQNHLWYACTQFSVLPFYISLFIY